MHCSFIDQSLLVCLLYNQRKDPEKYARMVLLHHVHSDLEKQTFLACAEDSYIAMLTCATSWEITVERATRVMSVTQSAMASQGIGRYVASAREHCPPLCISNPVVIPSCFPAILGASSFFLLPFLSRSVGNTPCIPTPSYVPALSAEERVKSARDWVH